MLHRPLALAAAMVLAGCGAASTRSVGGGAAGARPAAEETYPALRFVPPDATYAVVARRGADAAIALRESVSAIGLFGDFDVADASVAMRHNFGFDPLSADDLARVGIDTEASVALFSQGLSPTLALPVGDAASLQAFIDRRREGIAAEVTPRGGHEVASVELFADVRLEWATLDRWFLLHLRIGEEQPLAWFDAALAASTGPSLGGDPAFAAATAAIRPHLGQSSATATSTSATPDILGLARLDQLRPRLQAETVADAAGCWAAADISSGWSYLGATVAPDRVDAALLAPITPDGAAAITTHLAPDPAPGYQAFRAASGLWLDWSIDLDWLRQLASSGRCEPLRQALAGAPAGPFALQAAVQALDIDRLTGRLAAWLDVRGRGFAEELLGQIQGRSFFEHGSRVGTTPVTTLSVPMLPEVVYHSSAERFIVTVGDRVMPAILAQSGSAAAPQRELGGLFIAPSRVPGLLEAITSADAMLSLGNLGARTARRLGGYQSAAVGLHLLDRGPGDAPSLLLTLSSRPRR